MADVGQDTRKGLHPALLIALIAALGFGVWWLLTRGSHYLLGGVAGASNGVRVASHVEPASVPASTNRLLVSGWTNSSAPRGQTALTTEAVSHSEPTANNPPQPEVFLTGKAVVDGKVWVFLSDGRRYNSDNKQLRWIGDGAVIIGTNLYQFARTDRTASPVPGSTVGSFKLH